MLFSQRFFCRPFLPPCKIVLVSPADLDSCPYRHVIIGPDGLVMWSLYEMPSSLQEHLISVACNFFRMSDINVQLSQACNCTEITRERIRLILEGCAYRSRWSSVLTSLARAAVVCTILDVTSGLKPWCVRLRPDTWYCQPRLIFHRWSWCQCCYHLGCCSSVWPSL